MPLQHAAVVDHAIDTDALVAAVETPAAGAAVLFVGRIRDHDPEASGRVVALDYTCHPDADALIKRIAAATCARVDPDGEALVAVEHRVGRLEIGDVALFAAVATPHRALGFALCAELVEDIKRDLPIWKHQHEESGRAVWSNLGLASDA